MYSASNQKTNKSCRHLRTRSLRCESLETRELLATTYMILDFTPDSHAGSFVDTFLSTRLPNSSYAPNFLDFNGDRWVNAADASIAAKRVANRVAGFYSQAAKGYDVRIRYGDVTRNTNWGTQWVNYGKYYSGVEVAVMYFGGTSRDGAGILGRAPLASDGGNFEGYGETYTRSAATTMAQWTPRATTNDFVELVARIASHELGHMFGLRHIQGNDLRNVMNASTPVSPVPASFVNRSFSTTGGWAQNAFQEIRNSFRGQYQQTGQPYLGGQYATVDLGSTAVGTEAGDLLADSLATAEQVDGAMASLMSDGMGVLTLEGAQTAVAATLAFASTGANHPRADLAAGAHEDVAQRHLVDLALATPWQPTGGARGQTGQAGPASDALAGEDLPDGTRPLRRAKDRLFGSRFVSRDALKPDLEVSRPISPLAALA